MEGLDQRWRAREAAMRDNLVGELNPVPTTRRLIVVPQFPPLYREVSQKAGQIPKGPDHLIAPPPIV